MEAIPLDSLLAESRPTESRGRQELLYTFFKVQRYAIFMEVPQRATG